MLNLGCLPFACLIFFHLFIAFCIPMSRLVARALPSAVRQKVVLLLHKLYDFFCNTSFSSGFSSGCRCLEVDPFEENMTLTPHFACKRYLAGKRKKIRREPVGYSNQSFPAERHRMSRIVLASLFPADPLMRALVVHFLPCSRLRKDHASRQSFNRYNCNANPQRIVRACCCSMVGGCLHTAPSHSLTGTLALLDFTALAIS